MCSLCFQCPPRLTKHQALTETIVFISPGGDPRTLSDAPAAKPLTNPRIRWSLTPGRNTNGAQQQKFRTLPRPILKLAVFAVPTIFCLPTSHVGIRIHFQSFSAIFGPLKASIAQIYYSTSVSVKLGLVVGTRCPANDQEVELAPTVRPTQSIFVCLTSFSACKTPFSGIQMSVE